MHSCFSGGNKNPEEFLENLEKERVNDPLANSLLSKIDQIMM